MSIKNQIIVVVLCFLMSFFYIRGFLYGVKRYQLNKSAYRKKVKGETFKEWLIYSRFREEIPKTLLILYFLVLLIHSVCLFVCLLLYIIKLPQEIGGTIAKIVAYFDLTWTVIIALLFWSPGRDYAYDRWIIKKRGQKRNRKKR